MIRKNCLSLLPGEGVCSARAGLALLGGILRCGRCGRKLYVAYHGKSGSAARYICKGDYESDGKYCLAFGGSTRYGGGSGSGGSTLIVPPEP